MDERDQTGFACDLYCAVAGQFNCISAIARSIGPNRYYRPFCVVAERLIDLVTNCEFGSHRKSFAHGLCG
jgi:hypothetical protein